MPYTVRWLDEPHILLFEASGALTEEDLHTTIETLVGLIKDVDRSRVHSLILAQEITSMPSLPALIKAARLLNQVGGEGINAFCGMGRLVRYLLEVVGKATNICYKVFNSYEAAEAFLRDVVAAEVSVDSGSGEGSG